MTSKTLRQPTRNKIMKSWQRTRCQIDLIAMSYTNNGSLDIKPNDRTQAAHTLAESCESKLLRDREKVLQADLICLINRVPNHLKEVASRLTTPKSWRNAKEQ